MITRRFKKRAAVVCLGAILALLILGVAVLPRAEFTSCRYASGEADRPVMAQNGVMYKAKKVT